MARQKEAPERKTGVAGWKESEGTAQKRASVGGRSKRAAADRRRRLGIIACVLVACVISVVFAFPIQERVTRGLWFKGGTANTMKADGEVSSEDLSKAISTINARLGKVGVSEFAVDASGSDAVVIKLPWNVDGKQIAESVSGAGVLEFARVDEIGDADALALISAGSKDAKLKKGTYSSFLDDSHVRSCEVTPVGDGAYAITVNFDEEGTKKFAEVTEELAKDYGSIAIVIDGRVVASPGVSEKIDGGQVSISGGFTQAEAGAIKSVIDTDRLANSFALQSSEEIGPLVGQTTLWVIAGAAVAAIVVVAVAAFTRMRKTALLVLGTEVVLAVIMLGEMAVMSRIEVYVLSMAAFVGGVVACGCGVIGAWQVAGTFVKLVKSGKSVRGSSLAAASEALTRYALPVSLVAVVSLVALFLPFPILRDAGLSIALGIIASAIAILLFEVPLMRVLATGSMQNDLAAWGLEVSATEADAENKTA